MKRVMALLLAAAGLLSLTACTQGRIRPEAKYQLAAAQYPEMARYPDEGGYTKANGEFDSDGFDQVYNAWLADRRRQLDQPEGYTDALDDYLRAAVPQLLSGGGTENQVCSPLNVYMALAMLAEVTEGESRRQVLEALGSGDLDALRAETSAVWNANYCDDGAVTSVLASSLWLNEQVNYRQETVDALARYCYASSFRGEMGSVTLDKALQAWVNEQTGGLLKEQASGLHLDRETVLALASTVYFRAKWDSEFSDSRTAPGTFHGAVGDTTCDFMHQGGADTYYWGDHFSAVARRLEGSGAMWLLLPDEGVEPEELLAEEQALDLLLGGGSTESKRLIVNLSLPKFDVASDLDLTGSLRALGITDVFDPNEADFSPLTDSAQGIFLSQPRHAARVAIDEEGVTAAAYTVMMMAGAAMPPEEEVDFVLDRPFVFAVTGADGLPLFVGIVRQVQG